MSTARPRGATHSVSLATAMFDGLAPDGGLYMPESIEPWPADDLAALPSQTLIETAVSALRPFVADEVRSRSLTSIVELALSFPIPLVEIEPGVLALELFHGPTLAFKDVGARMMAALMAALHEDDETLTIVVATSGDTGSAVGHAFDGLERTRVVILYPQGGVSPTQAAQLTMLNGEPASNVRAYAVEATFDDCQRLVKTAFADDGLRRAVRLTSANSINIGRLLPQMIYYFHAAGALAKRHDGGRRDATEPSERAVFATPSGNFGNVCAGLMAKRAGAPIASFVAATNVNDVVPRYLSTGRFEPRESVRTIANAMDCGNPSNFDRMRWLYDGDVVAMRRDVAGSAHTDEEVRETIRRVYEDRGYLLDPHSAIAYSGLKAWRAREKGHGRGDRTGVLLATAHPAKFAEIVEPIIGRPIEKPSTLTAALGAPRAILRLAPTMGALRELLVG